MGINSLVSEIKEYLPEIVALSYRLSPESITPVLEGLKERINDDDSLKKIEFIFGTTKPVAAIAEKSGIFSRIFTGEDGVEQVEEYLKKEK